MTAFLQFILSFVGLILGSGLIQFFFNRKDSQKEEIKQLTEEFNKALRENEDIGKQRFEENQESINQLTKAIEQLSENDAKQTQYMKHMGEALAGLAHDKLVRLSDQYQRRGAITLKEKATLEAIYKPYHEGLGGNGDGQAGYEFCLTLPVVTDEEAKEMDKEKLNV